MLIHVFLFFPGSGFIMCSGKENPDSDADLDVDGDDTLEYGKPQYRFWKALTEREPRGASSASFHTALPWVVVNNLCSALLEMTLPSPVTMLVELGGIPSYSLWDPSVGAALLQTWLVKSVGDIAGDQS